MLNEWRNDFVTNTLFQFGVNPVHDGLGIHLRAYILYQCLHFLGRFIAGGNGLMAELGQSFPA